MLKLENYKIIYPDKTINFPDMFVKENEFVGISGDSGCGKTSLLNSIFDYDFKGEVIAKTRAIRGKDIKKLGKEKYEIISYCPQFAQDALNPKLKVKEHIDLVLLGNKLNYEDVYLQEIMDKLKLPKSILNHYPYMLSGGQKQRVVLLLSIIKKPQLLILDEPSSAIDLITLKIIIDFLEELKGTITIIMVSHNKDFLGKLCNRIIKL